MCCAQKLWSYVQSQGENRVKGQILSEVSCPSLNFKTKIKNLIKFQRKIRHNDKVSCILDLFATPEARVTVRGLMSIGWLVVLGLMIL